MALTFDILEAGPYHLTIQATNTDGSGSAENVSNDQLIGAANINGNLTTDLGLQAPLLLALTRGYDTKVHVANLAGKADYPVPAPLTAVAWGVALTDPSAIVAPFLTSLHVVPPAVMGAVCVFTIRFRNSLPGQTRPI